MLTFYMKCDRIKKAGGQLQLVAVIVNIFVYETKSLTIVPFATRIIQGKGVEMDHIKTSENHFKRMTKPLALLLALAVLLGAFGVGDISVFAAEANAEMETYFSAEPAPNFMEDGGFENYALNTKLSAATGDDCWYGVTDTGSKWPTVTVTNEQTHSGTRSAALFCMYNACYRKITGLEKNTDYIFEYYYNLPAYTADNVSQMRCVSVISENAAVEYTGTVGCLNRKNYAAPGDNGTGQWKSDCISFNSGENTAVYVLFGYNAKAGSGINLYIDDIGLYKASDCLPNFQADYGSVAPSVNAQGEFTLTAKSAEGCGFRGWYLNGTEVGIDFSFTGATPETAYQYTAEFYSFNLLENGNFEPYNVGQNMKAVAGSDCWYGATDSTDWTTASIVSSPVHSGSKALALLSMYNTAYRRLNNLQPNTQYTVSFYYYLPPCAGETRFLNSVSVIGGNNLVRYTGDSKNGVLNSVVLDTQTGSCNLNEWKKCSLTFYTGENTSVFVCLRYAAPASAAQPLYVDDMILLYDPMAAPAYANQNFELSNGLNYYCSKSISINRQGNVGSGFGSYQAKIASTERAKIVASAPIQLKKGFTYTFGFYMDLREYPMYTAATVNTAKPVDAYVDYTVLTKQDDYSTNYLSAGETPVVATYHDVSGNQLYQNSVLQKAQHWFCRANTLSSGYVHVQLTFQAPRTQVVYFATRLNEMGTVYFDNFTVTETDTASVADKMSEYVLTKVGSAVRVGEPVGLRHKTRLDKRALCAENYFGARLREYGTLALRADYLGENSLQLNQSYEYSGKSYLPFNGLAYSLQNGMDLRYDDTDRTLDFTTVLTGIAEENYETEYTMRAYAGYMDQNNQVQYIYGPQSNNSVYRVAKAAYSAKRQNGTSGGTFCEDKSTRDFLKQQILNENVDYTVNLKNNSTPVTQRFQGFSATVYHCYTFMNDMHGRNYTDAQAAIEMDRLVDSGITTVRSIFKSSFAWDNAKGWNWDSVNMQAIYKWAKCLQNRQIEIAFNAGWHLNFITEETSSIPEVAYLLGKGEDRYQESAGVDFTGMSDYDIRIKKASLRYGEWMRQALRAMEAHGVYNVKYVLAFTEPSYATADLPEGKYASEWVIMTKGLHEALKNDGTRAKYKIVGPNQSYTTGNGLMRYYLEYIQSHPEDKDMVDILTNHRYSSSHVLSIHDETYYHDVANDSFADYKQTMNNYNYTGDFWVDEYFAFSNIDATWKDNNGVQLTQTAAGFTAAMNNGMNRLISWQIFDQQWVNQGNTGGEFVSGVHAVGTCPSFVPNQLEDYAPYSSEVPRVTYYGLNLLGKYVSSRENAVVYQTQTNAESGLYTGVLRHADGKVVILAVNTKNQPLHVNFQFEKAIDSDFYRYAYVPSAVTPSADATSIAADTTLISVQDEFSDVLPAQSFAVYVSKLGYYGREVEVDVGEEL